MGGALAPPFEHLVYIYIYGNAALCDLYFLFFEMKNNVAVGIVGFGLFETLIQNRFRTFF